MSVKIVVPASTANLGPGFDSIGMALNLYLTVTIGEKKKAWEVIHPFGEDIPTDETNLIIETALSICSSLEPHTLYVESEIPLTRGLGSSGSAIVAGIEIANVLGNLYLSQEEKIQIAAKIEGHPDNIVPSILGGIVVGMTVDNHTTYCTITNPSFDLIAVIPETELKTSLSRSVLPETLTYKQAVTGSAIANVLVASLYSGDNENLSAVLEKDIFHEPYRKKLIPIFEQVREIVKQKGGYGTVLSGAGPALLAFIPIEDPTVIIDSLQQSLPASILVKKVKIDKQGLKVYQLNTN
ncbi:MAG: homoserine kinase [Bacillaceae bacterium]